MLISHRKKFIFTKTVKTAGTSVESFFEKYCMPEGEWNEAHAREEYVTDTGIIGYRGRNRGSQTWYNHMPASTIRDLIGPEIWDQYFKFTVIRNPFDKLVSGFYFFSSKKNRTYTFGDQVTAYTKKLLKQGKPIERVTGKSEIERFRNWIKLGGTIIDRNKYLIDGQVCVDYFIQFEDLFGGVQDVCTHLSIPSSEVKLPTLKKSKKNKEFSVKEHYDAETEAIVRRRYAWEFEQFNYEMPS